MSLIQLKFIAYNLDRVWQKKFVLLFTFLQNSQRNYRMNLRVFSFFVLPETSGLGFENLSEIKTQMSLFFERKFKLIFCFPNSELVK